ncbi:DUF2938 domain-containing protein [Dasania sp. GY-MA-18]|uniref:DUF2938 domain-containing protein n=1 Tax=Dasania phycosphaerae TaxID=2950436 RepID=A0A9J6RS36_9GAMM|nr:MULTISPECIES: DUF2938 domain-containing protein [Dasania]MCR8924414.1 DUF2938 domain-containing protein [Dasania sp. GY-MA-18]MCZ0867089.1 DUF2938 domain-containing protein [Dasania phycosphaerae]MCZ0870541.1 DUF2938 domain-containing protein [Dasania phycosphaerae]
MSNLLSIVLIGIGATAVMDLWSIARKPLLAIPPPNYGLVGRWLAHMGHGQFRHEAIAASPRIPGERILGWVAHYLIGVAFAALLVGMWGESWLRSPTIAPALIVGIATVVAPFLLMQPGMGAGIAACKTPRPSSARVQSLITHTVFGLGLYVSGWALKIFNSL